jgi:hypothetical protein
MMKPYPAVIPRGGKSPDRDISSVASPRGMGSIAQIPPAPAGRRPAGEAAGWLSLAAAPTFAFMALLAASQGGGPAEALCAAMPGASALGGMAPMYLLMSAFHLPPWLRLAARRRRAAPGR